MIIGLLVTAGMVADPTTGHLIAAPSSMIKNTFAFSIMIPVANTTTDLGAIFDGWQIILDCRCDW